MNNAKSYYKLFSVNLLRFIKCHGVYPISKGVHPKTKKNFWVFEVTDELSEILTAWSKNRANIGELEWKVGQ